MIEQILADCQAYLRGHFLLTSGRHSEYYIEKIKLINNPMYVQKLCQQLCKSLKDVPCDVVCGPAYGGIVLAYEVARTLKKRFVFTQRDTDQKMTIRSGFEVKPGDKVIIIEDIVTTGGSVNEVLSVLESLHAEIQAIACIVDRSNYTATFRYPFIPLHTMQITTWGADECPLCKNGVPLLKPGASGK